MNTSTPPPCWMCDQLHMIMREDRDNDALCPEERIAWLWSTHERHHIEKPAES